MTPVETIVVVVGILVVLPPIKLSKPRAEYGLPTRPEGGMWRNDRDPESGRGGADPRR